MEGLILLGVVVLLCGWIYQNGKRTGSRKGFWVGRDRGRGRR